MTNEERTLAAGLELNAELIANKYNYMVFDSGVVTSGATAPVSEIARKPVTVNYEGTSIEWSATIQPGDFPEPKQIKAVWMAYDDGEGNSAYLAVHVIPTLTVNSTQGITYVFPYSITGYMEEYE